MLIGRGWALDCWTRSFFIPEPAEVEGEGERGEREKIAEGYSTYEM